MAQIELSAGLKDTLCFAAEQLKGSARRVFMAKTVQAIGRGGQRLAERDLGWNRGTIRQSNIVSLDAFHLRGRKKAEEHHPQLLEEIQQVVAPHSQTDPTFKTMRRYTRLTAKQVRTELEQLPAERTVALPSIRTFNTKLNELGFRLRSVKKSEPLKKIPETEAIFASAPVSSHHQGAGWGAAGVLGCQSPRQNRLVFTGWAQPGRDGRVGS
jgi:hypothetical protein